jgi:predicted  nucleic acid-binding Zn-ribbon protein
MPHQCVKCSRIIPLANKELIEGCEECGGRFFFYIRDEQAEKLKQVQEKIIDIPDNEKKLIEKDVREMAGIEDENTPVILDLESVRSTGSGKFEIDVVNLFRKDRPIIYKIEEGKYLIDLASSLGKFKEE